MSGGSWDYLYRKDDDLNRPVYAEMADTKLSDFPDAAARLRRIFELTTEAREIHREMEGVMRAVEWVDSCDWGPESIAKAVEEWRAKK